MYLKSLLLEEFRSYHRQKLELSPRGLGLHGANASGKSTVLEAIAMLATTRSPRTTTERELINWQSGTELGVPPFGRIEAELVRNGENVEIEIGIQADPYRVTQVKKQIKVNGRSVRAMDAVGRLNAVLFSPEDLGLVTGPPALRRRYLDLVISQIDRRYLRALARFSRMLEQRNSLLRSLGREGVAPSSTAAGEQLARAGFVWFAYHRAPKRELEAIEQFGRIEVRVVGEIGAAGSPLRTQPRRRLGRSSRSCD
jgi:DNA replication and repair protein RecF